MNFAFFGTDEFSVIILEELKNAGLLPARIVTATDKKMGRGMRLTPPPVKLWAQKNNISFLQPEKLDDGFFFELSTCNLQLFIVASYGKIIPKKILDIPTHSSLNVHPSLLPLYRGPSPLETQILDGAGETGVTIMKMDEEMDHGPILAQRELGQVSSFKFQVATCTELHDALAHLGGALLAETIPKWLAGEITPQEQEHEKATYTKKITKADGLISLDDDAEKNYRKFRAYTPWPGLYFFHNDLRVKITDAGLEDGKFVIKKVIPAGRREMRYEDFKK
ncbi:MAG: methionyl-tRNA formyltransferase [Candidatus Lloydbacteria bacterium RIFCSPHIGHO2_02_FULL_51_22]|uniref:methionyl-tRNA formyltransferase n=3 Tax=Candidatus Lloydiibacteriota TaxID=1817910 RepID=A0A1G2DBA7_9BACT|nr:MAG: methionyl-tRNA formyltransferase [Candidatus Lloydbacteria bacterium RIFCSPHIGHO2_02_FULL_51_22]OGZ14355.1 MAG: methionyl-tRNA formyltransferase [Candidatus Lloydbacteria bacterium RIFCSPLOWO2_02_FULL_51_11]OGZ16399.1 MAG: methionyl-tRNA formyltransferase [Candidatus Lloydbacteria bacterium RIFCSPLOWO2_12_FULL_51_9]